MKSGSDLRRKYGGDILPVIVWQKTLDGLMESEFLKTNFFSGLSRFWRFVPIREGDAVPIIGNALYLSHNDDMMPCVRTAIAQGCRNVGLLHMGDENSQCDHTLYPDVDYVIRVYWYRDLLTLPEGSRCQGVHWMPGGNRYGMASVPLADLMPTSLRSMDMFFVGFIMTDPNYEGDDRTRMVDVVKRHSLPATIIGTPGWAAGYGAATYAALMENAKFALIPRGSAAETIRLFDALETGAIPISLRHDFLVDDRAMGNPPFPVLDSWDELPALHQKITQMSAEELDLFQRQVFDWWTAFKIAKGQKLASIIERSFLDADKAREVTPPKSPSLIHFVHQMMELSRLNRSDFLDGYVDLCFPNYGDVVVLIHSLLNIQKYQEAYDAARYSSPSGHGHPIPMFAMALGEILSRISHMTQGFRDEIA